MILNVENEYRNSYREVSAGIFNSRKLSSVQLTIKNDPAELTKFAFRMLSACVPREKRTGI